MILFNKRNFFFFLRLSQFWVLLRQNLRLCRVSFGVVCVSFGYSGLHPRLLSSRLSSKQRDPQGDCSPFLPHERRVTRRPTSPFGLFRFGEFRPFRTISDITFTVPSSIEYSFRSISTVRSTRVRFSHSLVLIFATSSVGDDSVKPKSRTSFYTFNLQHLKHRIRCRGRMWTGIEGPMDGG